jgi:uncharacterized protein YggE
MSKAEAMAQAMGGRIVRVVEEREGGFPAPAPTFPEALHNLPYDYSSANANSNANMDVRGLRTTPLEAGTLSVRSQVFLVVEVEAQPQPR